MARRVAECGVDSIHPSDTVGFASPTQIRRLVPRLRDEVGEPCGAIHLHNTRGQGLANVVAALDVGVTAVRLVARRPRRLSLRARARPATSSPRISSSCSSPWGSNRCRHRPADRSALDPRRRRCPARNSTAMSPTPDSRRASWPRRTACERGSAPYQLPLAGVRVVEFSHVVMGPAAGSSSPTSVRTWSRSSLRSAATRRDASPARERRRLHDVQPEQAECRRSMSGHPRASPSVKRLIARADVLIENFRPGALDAVGLGLRRAQRRGASSRLLLAQRFPLAALRAASRTRRGRADDGRSRLHDGAAWAAASSRRVRQRRHGRRLRRHR